MSETTRFLHPRPFPFCESEAPLPSGGDEVFFDYVELTGSDGGLAEAMRIWWNLENINYSTTFGDFELEDLGNPSYVPDDIVGGSVVASAPYTPTSLTTAAAPSQRVCYSSGSWGFSYALVFRGIWIRPTGSGAVIIFIANDGAGQWRMYYSFAFRNAADSAIITMPSQPQPWPSVDSGTADLFGYSVDWECFADTGSGVTSASLSISSTFFTYPAP